MKQSAITSPIVLAIFVLGLVLLPLATKTTNDEDNDKRSAAELEAETERRKTLFAQQQRALAETSPMSACQGDSNTWNAGYGPCSTYAANGGYNHRWCSFDYRFGLHAFQVCSECGQCGSCVPAPPPPVPCVQAPAAMSLAAFDDYVIVDRFDRSFWGQRSQMGYSYHQRSFSNLAEMLEWSQSNGVDWGWKEGSGYGQLFYSSRPSNHAPPFDAGLRVWNASDVNFCSSDACGDGQRCAFVKKEVLLNHPSWRGTTARSAYVAQTVAAYGDYVAVDRFDNSFWSQRSQMGFSYQQRNFATLGAMLDWSQNNNISWGWKEGSNYGQLFYQGQSSSHTPAFSSGLRASAADQVNFSAANACASGGRCSFVRKSVLVNHPSWQTTAARSSYVLHALAKYGEYIIVDRFDSSFWSQRSAMGYAYSQQNFATMADMLDWSAQNNIDWGWKEGSNYGQLFYKSSETCHTPAFASNLQAWNASQVNFFASDACGGGRRCAFVKKGLLRTHPSWAGTVALAQFKSQLQLPEWW